METENENYVGKERTTGKIWMGLIFILAGAFILINQFDLIPIELNWWALFILMPAAGAFSGAFSRYRADGNRLSMGVATPALVGLFMAGLAISLLTGMSFDINWNLFWPVMIILIGVGMIFGRARSE